MGYALQDRQIPWLFAMEKRRYYKNEQRVNIGKDIWKEKFQANLEMLSYE